MTTDTPLDFSEALLYRANNDFIEGNRAQPYNAQEILSNIESGFGPSPSKIALWWNGFLVLIAILFNMGFALVVVYGVIRVFELRRVSIYLAGVIGAGGLVISVWITKGVARLLPRRLSVVPPYTPVERASIYRTLCEAAEVVNGTIVDVASLSGYVMITYTVKSPTYEVIRKTYTTKVTTYTRADIGKEVAVLYLNEAVNVLL
jgi:hypothetical protein